MAANITVTIRGSAGNFTADVDDHHKRVERLERVKWKVHRPEPADFPANGVIFIKFTGKDPLFFGNKGRHNGSRNSNDHSVSGTVDFSKNDGYDYKIFYSDSSGDHLLLDPELVVDGGPFIDKKDKKPKTRPARAAKKAKKAKAAKKAKKAKTAKKARPAKRATRAKKAKKAKRSTKRKAKKR